MLLRLALPLALCGVFPASASAAGFAELPFLPVTPAARCVRATGAPGEVVRWAPGGADLIQATATGFGAATRVPLGDVQAACPSAAAQPGGAGVLAAELYDDLGDAISVTLRDPGGAWMAPTRIPLAEIHSVNTLATAVDPGGDAVVAWSEQQELGQTLGARILVARRPAGGALGPPLELGPLHAYHARAPEVRVGIQADGTVIALWTQANPREEDLAVAFAAVAPPGGPFGPPQQLSDAVRYPLSLAVAPDGRALAVLPEIHRTLVLERPPGAAFAPAAVLGAADPLEDQVAVALRPDGAAIVAWADFGTLGIFAVRRDGPGPFGSPEPVDPAPEDPYGADLPRDVGRAPSDLGGRAVRAVYSGDGRAVLTWGATHALGNLSWAAASAATFPGGREVLSGPLRDADSIAPVILGDGRPAVVWSDAAPGGDAHLRLARESALPAPPTASERVRIGRIQQVRHGLVVPVRCSAACDVRASVPGYATGEVSVRGPGGGQGRLRIDAEFRPIEVRRPGSVPVRVLFGPPGAHMASARTVVARLRPSSPPVPRIVGLKAVRRGRDLLVRWRTERPLRGADLVLQATATRSPRSEISGTTLASDGHRSFQRWLDGGARARYLQFFAVMLHDATRQRVAIARIGSR